MSENSQATNILLLFWGRKGGGARYSLEIAKELDKRDDVNLFISVSNQCDLLDQFKEINCPGLYLDTYESVTGFIRKWVIERKRIQKKLTTFLKENNIDLIIIGMDFFWGNIIYKSADLVHAKTVYVVHEPKPHPGEPFFMGMVKKQTLKTLISGADHLVALTDHVKFFLQDYYKIPPNRISVIPHGVFSYHEAVHPKQLPSDSQEPVILLYFGAITYYKGLDILLKAFAILEKNESITVKLEIWGSGDMSNYQTLIEQLDHIHIENRWIDESEVGKLFERAHISVLPYRDVSQSGILGAASKAALPMVACPADGLRDQMGGESVIYSEDFSAESLADEISRLIQDPVRYKAISKKLMDESKKLEWSSIAAEFMEIKSKLLEQ